LGVVVGRVYGIVFPDDGGGRYRSTSEFSLTVTSKCTGIDPLEDKNFIHLFIYLMILLFAPEVSYHFII
jgi:hypothetical protein